MALRLARTHLYWHVPGGLPGVGSAPGSGRHAGPTPDIFWLTDAEIAAAACLGGPAWAALAAACQVEFSACCAAPAPPADGYLRAPAATPTRCAAR
ncbi:MAG: hypothetical protein ACRYG7_16230 [Janthinobacterium lividum]